MSVPSPIYDTAESLVDALADGDIRPAAFVKRYMALGYTREESRAVVMDNIMLGNLDYEEFAP